MRRAYGRTLLATWIVISVLGIVAMGESILLPRSVSSFNQNYTEGPDAWGDCSLGTRGCPDQICTTGCLVTAFSCVLGYYDIEVTVPASASCIGRARTGMDPGILNDWLRANGGFGHCAQDPLGDCCLAWSQLPGDIELTFHANRSDDGLNPISSVVIDHALRSGEPVVAGVHWDAFCRGGSSQSEDCHWVVLTGKIGDRYTIVDPMNLDASDPNGVRTTLDAGTRGAYIIDRFVVVSRAQPTTVATSAEPTTQATAPVEEPAAQGPSALVLLALIGALAAIVLLATRGD